MVACLTASKTEAQEITRIPAQGMKESMNIVSTIDIGDFEGFLDRVRQGDTIIEQYGPAATTALHAIAAMVDQGTVVSLFNRKKRPWDYFIEMKRLPGSTWAKAVKIQNCQGNTPIHVAIANGQWDMARVMGQHADYGHSPKYVKNNDGLSELGLALALYGVQGHLHQIASIFTYEKLENLNISKRLHLLRRTALEMPPSV